MKQEVVSRKIVRGFVRDGIISVDDMKTVNDYIQQAYAAGFNEGKHQYTKRRPVAKFSLDTGEMLGTWPSADAAGKAHGLNKSSISKAANGVTKHAGGFKWKYIPKAKSSL